jgi:hypothetical protein
MTVATNITAAQTAAAAALVDANTFLNSLITIATSAIIAGNNFAGSLPAEFNYNSVPTVDFPVIGGGLRPDDADLNIPGTPEAPSFTFFTPTEVTLPVDDLLAPTHNFEYLEAAYISALLDPLKAKLLADLTNGGFGIDTADEQALFQRARDRETIAAMTRIDEAGRLMAARGFPLPPGELSIQIDRSYQDLQNKMSSVSREIFVDSAKRFVENRQFTIQEVRQLETVLLGFHNSIQERALNVAKATAEYAVAVYNQLLARFRTRLEGAKIATDIQLGRAQVDIARSQAQLGVFQGQIAAYEARLRSLVEPFKARVDLYRADIDGNRNLTDGFAAKAALQQKVLEATSQQNIDISRLNVENTRARLQATMAGLQFGMEATKFGSQQLFATLAAMWGSLNTLSVQSATEA